METTKSPTGVATLYETRDYEMFKPYAGNRNINPVKVKDLLRSFNERLYPVPIVVDQENQVLDGQHRLEAAKAGGFPVVFLRLTGDIVPTQVIRQLNTGQKPHTLPDYMKLYVEDGRGDYIQFQNLYEHYDKTLDELGVTVKTGGPYRIVFTSMLGLMCGRDSVEKNAFLRHASNPWNRGTQTENKLSVIFRNGEIDLTNASKGVTTLDYLMKIFSVLPRQRAGTTYNSNGRLHRNRFIHLRTREYLCSIHYLLHYRGEHIESENEAFDPQVFLTQVESYPNLCRPLEDKPKEWTNALRHIEDIYNHKRGNRKYTYLASL